MDNWQAFVPPTHGTGDQLEPGTDGPLESVIGGRPESAADARPVLPASLPPGAEERARTLSLIDFLADYDARKNPPVPDIGRYDIFLMRDAELPSVPGVNLSPAAQAWLTVDFLDLPPRPEVPEDLVGLLGETADISPHARPEVRTTTEDTALEEDVPEPEPDPESVLAAEEWIVAAWEPFATRWAEASAAKTLYRDLFLQRERLARDRESVELVWGFGRLRWKADDAVAVLDHPLATIPVEVEQDDTTQRIRVCPAGAPEVETRCLAALSLADRAGFMSIRQSVNDDGLDPWDSPALEGVLRPLVRAIDHEGMLVEQAPPPRDDGHGRSELGSLHAPAAAGLPRVLGPHASPVPGRVGSCTRHLAGDCFRYSVGLGGSDDARR